MELRHLRYFVAVAEELNYRKASERLRVAQPALSSQIKDLEYELGVKLLDRDTGGVRLNDAGAAFLIEARLILAHAQQAMVVAREAAKGLRGQLTIAYYAPLLMGFMPASLKAFRETFPEVEVNLLELPLGGQIAALESGEIQIGFAINGSTPIPAHLKHVMVARSPIRAVVGREHPLARKSRIALADLVDEPLLCLTPKKGVASVHGEIMRQGFLVRGLKPGPIRQIEGAEAFRANLESGMGVSLIAEIGSLSKSPDLVFKPLKDSGADLFLELHALWRDGQTSQLTTNFIALMQKTALKEKPGGRRVGRGLRSAPRRSTE
jgi:LysR family transcriptional regulator, benzoate and cis,cis-muconate-responsive activator of ben and cat genes